jgi:hypothetical protein
MIKSIRNYFDKLKLNACRSLHETKLKASMHFNDRFNLSQTRQIGANCMLFMGKQVESNMRSNDQVQFESNLAS